MRVVGKTTSSTGMASRNGRKERSTRAITTCHRRKGWASISMRMDRRMRGNGWRIRSVDLESISGPMVANTTGSGKRTICMAAASTSTQITSATMVNSSATRRKASALIVGQTDASTLDGGIGGNSTGLALTMTQEKEVQRKASGRMERESSG